MAETPEKEPQAETLDKETQLDEQPVAPNGRSGRMPVIVVSLLALAVMSGAAVYALPKYNIALPNFNSFAELLPRETAPVPKPDPAVSSTLKDIQSAQQQNAAVLQENGAVLQQNTAMLQRDAATLESLRQGFTTQQANLKTVTNQLSTLIARMDSVQNAVAPLTTSSIPKRNARALLVGTSRKKASRLSKPVGPVGPVSIGGAPLSPAPAPRSGAG